MFTIHLYVFGDVNHSSSLLPAKSLLLTVVGRCVLVGDTTVCINVGSLGASVGVGGYCINSGKSACSGSNICEANMCPTRGLLVLLLSWLKLLLLA